MECIDSEVNLVLGATSILGRHIVKSLLEKSKRVKVIINNYKQLTESFSENELNKIEYFFNDNKNDLSTTFSNTSNYIISVLNINYESPYINNENTLLTNRLIDAAIKNGKITRFCLISSSYVRRPYSCISYKLNSRNYFLNTMSETEDYLRKSKLNYLIIRPVEMIYTEEATDYTITQGDIAEGKISVNTVGRLVADTLYDPWVPSNTSYECFSSKEQQSLSYSYNQGMRHYRTENEPEKVRTNHIKARRIIHFGFFSFIFVATIFLYKIGKRSLWKQKFWDFWKRLLKRGTHNAIALK